MDKWTLTDVGKQECKKAFEKLPPELQKQAIETAKMLEKQLNQDGKL